MKSEEAFRTEIYLSIVFIPLGLWIGHSPVEKILLSGSILLLLIIELLNTAIERAIDRISYDHHELSKESKDMGSAAVLLGICIIALTWGTILLF